MLAKRFIRNRKRRIKKGPMELDITSLLDILVVILIFLLKSYSTSNTIINVPEEIKLPKSLSQSVNTEGITLQVSQNTIFVDDQVVTKVVRGRVPVDRSGLKILPLYNELVKKRVALDQVAAQTQTEAPKNPTVNLVMDKTVKYNFLRKLMYTCGEAGFVKFKFVVLGHDS